MIEMDTPTTTNKDIITLPPATAAPPATPIIISAKTKTIQMASGRSDAHHHPPRNGVCFCAGMTDPLHSGCNIPELCNV